MLLSVSPFTRLSAQEAPCALDIPSELAQQLIEKQPLIEEFIANIQEEGMSSLNSGSIPVRFTQIVGPSYGVLLFTQLHADLAINQLNTAFAGSGMSFVQCGEVNEVWDDRITASEEVDHFITSFAYATGTLEVFIKPSIVAPYAPIPEQAYVSGNPNWSGIGAFTHTNFAKINDVADLGSTIIHETGHHFGLLHTFGLNIGTYNSPPSPTANDHPYPVIQPNGQFAPNWWGRELVIRLDDINKSFPSINFIRAGDLLKDTPADCSPYNATYFPGCPLSAQDFSTCLINHTVTYSDYNGDAINPPVSGYHLGRNYMSYWYNHCKNQFTADQLGRALFYYQTERDPSYTQNRCGTFTDNVELEGTTTGLHNVSIRVRHPNTSQKCNVTSSRLGKYSGLIHQDLLTTNIYQNGKRSALNFPNDPLKVHYDHTRCEWIRGVDVADLGIIQQHILGTPLANGYRIIAADASKSNTVTTFDIVELRRLILGIYQDFLPDQEQPWRFIPEFVPQNAGAQFNLNPFPLLGGGYLEQGWQYPIPNAGQRGLDGIKIGDVNFTWLAGNPCSSEFSNPSEGGAEMQVPPISLEQNDTIVLAVKTIAAQTVSAFQLGLKIPFQDFEIIDVIPNALPSYTKADNFGLNLFDQDALTTLWFSETGVAQQLPSESTLFRVIVKAKQNISDLQESISLDNSVTPSAFFNSASSPQTTLVGLLLDVTPASDRSNTTQASYSDASELSCDPNPVLDVLNVHFLNKGAEAQGDLVITNSLGAVVYAQNTPLYSGNNRISIKAMAQQPAGLYVVTLFVEGKSFTSKVLKN